MRDDARTLADELSRLYGLKLSRLQKLLLSETDKHHYENIGNMDKVSDIIRNDARMIEEINIIDCDIAVAEASLAALIGIKPSSLYDILANGISDAAVLIDVREQARETLGRLCGKRAELANRLESGAHRLRQDIDELSRISRLKPPDED
ncbi:MAG: hypothetical protein JW807_15825 [Spirochaetes bacterium]|nr:hypothetical protein [Spirochaetota bacterium]